jgi:HPr kinase/phosphorylase
MSSLTIKDLIEYGKERLDLKLIAGTSGINKELKDLSVQICNKGSKYFQEQLRPEGILIIGQEELSWLSTVSPHICQEILDNILSLNIPLIICSNTSFIPDFLVEYSEKESVPLAASDYNVFTLESRIIGLLREKLDHIVVINGVFVEVFGVGVIIVGESGIGKSECGLELVTRGHKLIADDVIEIHKNNEGDLSGRCIELTKYFMEIRGLGVINVKSLFGVASVSDDADINIMVEFVKWKDGLEFDRIESEEQFRTIMGIKIPLTKAPVRSGGSMATIVEIVARNDILKRENYRASTDLKERVLDKIKRGSKRSW